MTDTQSPLRTEQPPSVVGEITVGGDLSGLSAIGSNITQVHVGRLGNLVMPAPGPPLIERRPAPVLALGRRPRRFLDRDSETAAGLSAARAGEVVEFVGPDGAGKSTLLRELAHRLADDARRGDRAAVVLLDAGTQPLEDALQELFGLLYQTDRPYLPTGGQLRAHLQGWHAVVLVDDIGDEVEVRRLMDVVPDSGLVLTAGSGHRVSEVLQLPLRGLPADDAAALLRAFSAPGAPREERAVSELVQRLEARPGALTVVAASADLATTPLESLAATADPRLASYDALPDAARDVLRVLAAVPGLALTAQEASAATGEPVQATVDVLVERGLVEEVGSLSLTGNAISYARPSGEVRYRVTDSTAELVRAQADLSGAAQALLAVFDNRLCGTQASVPSAQEAHAARLVLLNASRRGRWREVLRLGRAVEAVLALTGHWGGWRQVLMAMLAAARQLHDSEAESFALHQLGSRALCLGQFDEAERLLTQALTIRQDAHDISGTAVTEHNLRLSKATAVPPDTGWTSVVWRLLRTSPRVLLLVVLALVALLVLAALLIRSSLAGPETPSGSAGSWQLTPQSLDFGALPLGRTAERSVSLTSALDGGAAAREVRVAGSDAADFRVLRNECGQAPPRGRACTITVAFSPGGQDQRLAQLELQGEDGRSASVPLRGRGTATGGVADVTPTALDFGRVALGTTTGPRLVTVTNSGDAPLVLGDATVEGRHAKEFRVEDRCPERLAPRGRCELLVRHIPDGRGARTATLTAGTGGELSVPLTGTGIHVVDETGPVITATDLIVEATSPDGAVVDLAPTARDDVDGAVDVECKPDNGPFPLGTTEVACRAEDRSGNRAEKPFDVTVRDSTPPVLDLPQPEPAEARSLAGALVEYVEPTASDAVDGGLRVLCSPASGSTFEIGSTTVRCRAEDGGGRSTTGTFEVKVRDTTPPIIGEPPEDPVVSSAISETQVEYSLPKATDLGEAAEVTCDPPSEASFGVGDTTVTCSADDGRGNTSGAVTFTVSVEQNVE